MQDLSLGKGKCLILGVYWGEISGPLRVCWAKSKDYVHCFYHILRIITAATASARNCDCDYDYIYLQQFSKSFEEDTKKNQDTLCACWLSKGRITNISWIPESIKLKLLGYVRGYLKVIRGPLVLLHPIQIPLLKHLSKFRKSFEPFRLILPFRWIFAGQLWWLGDVKRIDHDRLPKFSLEGTIDWSRPRGRPHKRWIENFYRKCIVELTRTVHDRTTYRALVPALSKGVASKRPTRMDGTCE